MIRRLPSDGPTELSPSERTAKVDAIVHQAFTELKELRAGCFLIADGGPQTSMRQYGSIPWALGCFSVFGAAMNQKFWAGNGGGVSNI